MSDLRYPVGTHDTRAPVTTDQIRRAIDDLRELPAKLAAALEGASESQLETPYRPGGWTVRQVVHHLADSHLNAYTRLRLALTEEAPTIRPYDEKSWADLIDARSLRIEPSLALLGGLHERWVRLLDSLAPADFERPLVHPEIGRVSVGQLTCLYGWHSRHHFAHILQAGQ